MAEKVAEVFTEVVVAPDYDDGAVEVLHEEEPAAAARARRRPRRGRDPADLRRPADAARRDRRRSTPSGDDPRALAPGRRRAGRRGHARRPAFAWRACRAVKSNAILLASGGASVGVGMGQVNRVDSCQLAVTRAGDRAAGSVAASDAFFPFADGPQILLDAGVRAIVQPGGSVRDEEVIEAAQAGRASRCTSPARDTSATEPTRLREVTQLDVTAQKLDGSATAAAIKDELKARVAALREQGIAPGPRHRSSSATTPGRGGTSTASTRTAPRSASSRSGSTCPGRPAGGDRGRRRAS